MGHLVGLMQNDPLRILQVQHALFSRRPFGYHQVIQKLSKLTVIGHVAAKDKPAIFMNDEKGVGPGAVAAVNFAVEAVNEDRKSDILQSLQVTRMSQFLLP